MKTHWQLEYLSARGDWCRSLGCTFTTFGEAVHYLLRLQPSGIRKSALQYRLTHPHYTFAGILCALWVRQ